MDTRLLGRWTNETGEPGEVVVEFSRDGNLTYSIREDGRVQKMLLTFSVADGVIRTDQPSQPRVEETRYRIIEDGRLELNYNGEITTYVRTMNKGSDTNKRSK